jgi:predicted Zn-dependent protease
MQVKMTAKPLLLKPVFNSALLILGMSILVGCQSTTGVKKSSSPYLTIEERTRPAPSEPAKPAQIQENRAKRTPLPEYAEPAIQSQRLPSALPAPRPVQPRVVLRDGSNIPAFGKLMAQAQQQIQANQLNAAEQTLIQAQRMAPQSAAVYARLSEIALKKRQGNNAEAMARKGLMLTSNPRQQHAFWQLILASAELQNNAALASQARAQIQKLANEF